VWLPYVAILNYFLSVVWERGKLWAKGKAKKYVKVEVQQLENTIVEIFNGKF
jgi:hypothetical protein